MTMNAPSTASTLLDLFARVPAEKTAVILPDHDIRINYGSLRNQVQALAEQLAAAGVAPGARVGIALPNGLPVIVSFFAAAMAGTAAPLNPSYKEEEFRFYLEDTNARVLIVPPEGLDEARRAAAGKVRVLTVDMDARARVGFVGLTDRQPFTAP